MRFEADRIEYEYEYRDAEYEYDPGNQLVSVRRTHIPGGTRRPVGRGGAEGA